MQNSQNKPYEVHSTKLTEGSQKESSPDKLGKSDTKVKSRKQNRRRKKTTPQLPQVVDSNADKNDLKQQPTVQPSSTEDLQLPSATNEAQGYSKSAVLLQLEKLRLVIEKLNCDLEQKQKGCGGGQLQSQSAMETGDKSTTVAETKLKEQVKAERETKRLAKLAAKAKAKANKKSTYQVPNSTATEILTVKTENSVPANKSATVSEQINPIPENKNTSCCDATPGTNHSTGKHVKAVESSADGIVKTKAQLRAERRAVQEEQRATKAKEKAGKTEKQEKLPNTTKSAKPTSDSKQKISLPSSETKSVISDKKKIVDSPSSRTPFFVAHLSELQKNVTEHDLRASNWEIHPAVMRLGVQYSRRHVSGANERAVALVLVLQQVIQDYFPPPGKELYRDLEHHLEPLWQFLGKCRPHSISMSNVMQFTKTCIRKVNPDTPDDTVKVQLIESLQNFMKLHILAANAIISNKLKSFLVDDDVILTYGCSSLVEEVLTALRSLGRKFSVIVLDSRPHHDGKVMFRKLSAKGINCQYTNIASVHYVMSQVTKVILGADGFFSSGYVVAPVGTAQIALAAKVAGKMVITCCELYKSFDKAYADAFGYNEIENPDVIAKDCPALSDWKNQRTLNLLPLGYDVTPPNLISVLLTDSDHTAHPSLIQAYGNRIESLINGH